MKTFKNKALALATAIFAIAGLAACGDANEYKDADTSNPSWISENWTDSTEVAHPESIANTSWVRGSGLKVNAYGQEIQGFVASLTFDTDSVAVTMNEPNGISGWDFDYIWVDDSNTSSEPYYEYTYSNTTGKVEILKRVMDEKGKVSKSTIFSGIVVTGTKTVMTISHFGDTPTQTYLIQQ